MSDLVKRLLAQANKEANELEDMLNEAAERIGSLEAALRQARLYLQGEALPTKRQLYAAINDLLKD